MPADIIIRSDCIITCRDYTEGAVEVNGDSTCPEVIDGFITVENGRIINVEKGEASLDFMSECTEYIDARGRTVIPGLIDAHTHLIHGGSREKELDLKLKGAEYLDILKMGGGILSTVKSTRQASNEELEAKARKSLDWMLQNGTTTVEAKSGYGLDFETEVRCLELARELDAGHPIDIVSTYMGAHAVPPEYKNDKDGYIRLMTDLVMPYTAQHKLAEFVDVFCEEGVFSPEESRRLMHVAKSLGFKLKIHADEIIPLGGAELAAEMGAVSAEHLLAASEAGMEAMKKAGVTAVLLPGTSFCLMAGKYAQARKMLDMGIRVAIATDYNPGSCPTENLQTVMTFACYGMRLTPMEILRGMTINAAHAISRAREIGSIEVGKQADIVILNSPNLEYAVYHFGVNHVGDVIKNGRVVVRNERSGING